MVLLLNSNAACICDLCMDISCMGEREKLYTLCNTCTVMKKEVSELNFSSSSQSCYSVSMLCIGMQLQGTHNQMYSHTMDTRIGNIPPRKARVTFMASQLCMGRGLCQISHWCPGYKQYYAGMALCNHKGCCGSMYIPENGQC